MEAEIKFTPSESLLELADRFSKEFTTTTQKTFKSTNGKYELNYYDLKEKHTGKLETTYARVGMETGKIELNRRLLIDNDKIKPDFIFYLILWCVLYTSIHNLQKCDETILRYYKTTGRSPKYVILGWLEQSKVSPSTPLKERIIKMIDFIKSFFNINY